MDTLFRFLILPSSTKFFEFSNFSAENQVTVHTTDGAKLDCVKITNIHSTPYWVVCAMANASPWQHSYFPYFTLGFQARVNILCVNYRGTGKSTGTPNSFEDLSQDIDSAVQHLLDQNISSDH